MEATPSVILKTLQILIQNCSLFFSELKEGITLTDDNNNSLECQSKTAAVQGISSVVLSRIGMACPGMVLTPLAVQFLTNRGFFKRYPWANTPIQLGLVGAILIFATPLGCALFSQTASINVSRLCYEIEAKKKIISRRIFDFVSAGIITGARDCGKGSRKESKFAGGLL